MKAPPLESGRAKAYERRLARIAEKAVDRELHKGGAEDADMEVWKMDVFSSLALTQQAWLYAVFSRTKADPEALENCKRGVLEQSRRNADKLESMAARLDAMGDMPKAEFDKAFRLMAEEGA